MIVTDQAVCDPAASTRNAKDTFALATLAAVTWDFALVGRTRMLTEAWLRAGQSTLFVQTPSYRTALQRLTARLRNTPPRWVVRPWPAYPARVWPQLPQSLLLRAIRMRARELRRQLERRMSLSDVVALVVSPVWTPWLDEVPLNRVVYDCIDDISVHVPSPRLDGLYRCWEEKLVECAAGAVVTAECLGRELQRHRPTLSTRTIRNGVDAEGFRRQAETAPRPADLPDGKRPLIGFVGALYEWIDWALIERVMRELSDCDFVFVGPEDGRGEVERLRAIRNARFLGYRPYDQVPAYVRAFDVCWVPFDQSPASRAANPVKIYEYMALGKPVVSTPVADIESFGDHIRVGRDASEIGELLRAALDDGEDEAAARAGFAEMNSWDARAAEYVSFIESL